MKIKLAVEAILIYISEVSGRAFPGHSIVDMLLTITQELTGESAIWPGARKMFGTAR